MKNTKKNNKGFSLVELIVVVLIMAIIAVALAPQVMKWVNTSRESKDVNAVGSMLSIAKTEAIVAKNVTKTTVTIQSSGVRFSPAASSGNFSQTLKDSFGDMANYECASDGVFTITIEGNDAKCQYSGLEYADTLDLSGMTPTT